MSRLLSDIVMEQCVQQPDAIAVIDCGKQYTYRELDSYSNEIMARLLAINLKKGEPVLIICKKSFLSIAAFNGVMRSGGVFIPINAENTGALDEILHHKQFQYVIADSLAMERYDTQLSSATQKIVQLDNIHITENKTYQKPLPIITNDLAYILFTSGSTGLPKGVMIKHGSILPVIRSRAGTLEWNKTTRTLSLAPVNFDMHIVEVFGTLYAGGTIVLCPKWLLIDRVFSDIQEYQVTNFITVPTIFNLILKRSDHLMKYDVTSLKGIGFGGGRCLVKTIKALNRLWNGKVKFYHGYGMTETACHAFYYNVGDPEQIMTELLPLGQPIDDTQYFVLTKNRLAREGETGELVIRGYHLMEGYYQLPEETAHRLRTLPDEIGIQISDKVLYTGDFVRRKDGNIYFAGREDEQIKVSGYRIELAEIEKYIGLNDEVSEVAVISLPDPELENTIHCFVTLKEQISDKDLIEHSVTLGLKTFMIPTKIYIVNEIEKNRNGKIDKTKLIKIAKCDKEKV